MHPRNFGCDVSVRPPVHSLGGGKGIRCQPVGGEGGGGGGECYIFLVGNLAMHLCNPRIFLAENRARNGVVIVVAFKNLFTLGTFFQVVFKYLIA